MSRVPDEPCNICLENYNKKINNDNENYYTGNKITCVKCDYSSCTFCTTKYLLNSNNDAHCMNCKNPWDRNFLTQKFTKKFINVEYKKHRENILCEREKALLPATMKVIEKENTIIELRELKEKYRQEMEDKLYEFDVKIWELEHSSNKNKKEKNKFIKNCPVNDCNGFLSSQWKCGICSTITCKSCHEIIGKREKLPNGNLSDLPNHTCLDENIKTAMLLSKECKNCPKCASPIFKIDGCDQMWCVECQTAFSWRTSEIITGHFHNPHYYEWLRQNNNGNVPREPGDQPCGGDVHVRDLMRHLKQLCDGVETYVYKSNTFDIYLVRSFILSVHRNCTHLTHVTIEDFNRNNNLNDDNYLFNSNLKLRKDFLKGNITEEHFKKEVQKKEKKRQKFLNLKQIYQTFVTVCNDIFIRIINTNNMSDVINYTFQIICFINHINIQLNTHKDIYNCVTWEFDYIKEIDNIYQRDLGYYRRNERTNIRKVNLIRVLHKKKSKNNNDIIHFGIKMFSKK